MFYGITQLYKNSLHLNNKKTEDQLIETMALNCGTTKRTIRKLFATIKNQKTK